MYQIRITKIFTKYIKPLLKRYRNLLLDIRYELSLFDKARCIYLGENLYKIRLQTEGLRKGKRGSLRLIVHLDENNNKVVPIIVFYKGDIENISRYEIRNILNKINNEMYLSDEFR